MKMNRQRFSFCACCRRQVPAMIMIAMIIVCILTDHGHACLSGAYFNSRRRLAQHPFIIDEYKPASPESGYRASGPLHYSDLIYNPSTLDRLDVKSGPLNRVLVAKGNNATRMTKECKTKVTRLAFFVREEWQSRAKLRILNAWMSPRSDHKQMAKRNLVIRYNTKTSTSPQFVRDSLQHDYHSAGRAVDMDLIPVNPEEREETMNLGKLSELAYYKAEFSWCLRQKDFIHCSVGSEPSENFNQISCFPGSSTVSMESGEVKPLSRLRVGDRVRSVDVNTGKLTFSQVEMFLHRETNTVASYLRLKTEDNSTLTLSENHLMYRLLSSPTSDYPISFSSSYEVIYARDVRVGDRVFAVNSPPSGEGDHLRTVAVVSRVVVAHLGVYAPLTEAGNIVIDGHLTSCYAHVWSERLARWAFLPYQLLNRWWPTWTRSVTSSSISASHVLDEIEQEGIHWYPRRLYEIAKTVLPSSWLFSV